MNFVRSVTFLSASDELQLLQCGAEIVLKLSVIDLDYSVLIHVLILILLLIYKLCSYIYFIIINIAF